jgi:hypothetical protein
MYCCYFNVIFVLLTHFQPPILISSDDPIHHKPIGIFLLSVLAISNINIVIILILDACLSYISQSEPTRDEALDQACSQYCTSDIYIELMMQFSAASNEYSILQFTEFILEHHL